MVIGIIGENCAGKSTLAQALAEHFCAQIMAGKDYLRLAKSESEAVSLFQQKLKNALQSENIVYVISEKEQLALLPKGAVRILVKTDLAVIKERFRARMHGTLPPPVEQMLERKHGMFENGSYDFVFNGAGGDAAALCTAIEQQCIHGKD